MHLIQALNLIFGAFLISKGAALSSVQCTPGRSWTNEEVAEYKSLDSPKGWSGMDIITHCDIINIASEDSRSSQKIGTRDADKVQNSPGPGPGPGNLQDSAGDYVWIPYDTSCCSGEGINYVFSWSCGICYTIHGASIYSGELANGFESNEYFPIVEYYSEPRCQGENFLIQSLDNALHYCNSTGRYGAKSALLYSGNC